MVKNNRGQVTVITGNVQTFLTIKALKITDRKPEIDKTIYLPINNYFNTVKLTGNTQGLLFEPLKATISKQTFKSFENSFESAAKEFVTFISLYHYVELFYNDIYKLSSNDSVKFEPHYILAPLNSIGEEIPVDNFKDIDEKAMENLKLLFEKNYHPNILDANSLNPNVIWDFCNSCLLNNSK